jgi:ankyrin repeat protein
MKVVHILLEEGADVGARDHAGYTPLHAAAELGRAQIVRILLRAGADVTAVSPYPGRVG